MTDKQNFKLKTRIEFLYNSRAKQLELVEKLMTSENVKEYVVAYSILERIDASIKKAENLLNENTSLKR